MKRPANKLIKRTKSDPLTEMQAPPPRPVANERAHILLIGTTAECADAAAALRADGKHQCTQVTGLDEARAALAATRFDLLLIAPALPDGDGLTLMQVMQERSPSTKTIVFTDPGSFQSALRAVRSGATDFLAGPIDPDELRERVDSALAKSQLDRDREERIRRLQRLCSDLNVARREISDQVDALCNDLLAAYHDLTDQLNEVAMVTELRTLLRQELDVEDLLRTTLEFLLARTGPTNAAVFLPDSQEYYSLGAYVNYDCPRESIDGLLDHLCHAICPQMVDESELVAFDDADEFAEWIGCDASFLSEAQVIAFSCLNQTDCLAVVVLFRSKATPFEPGLASTLDAIRTIFAEQLANVLRVHHRAKPEWPDDAYDDGYEEDDYGFGYEGGLAA